MILRDSIKIKASPEKVFNWFKSLKDSESYMAWHSDHVTFQWIKGEPFREGSIVYFEENLHGELHKAKFLVKKVVPNKLIEYGSPFPWSIFMPGNQFIFEPEDKENCIFTATVNIRMGPLVRMLGKRQIEGIKRHMKEEGENLKTMIEK